MRLPGCSCIIGLLLCGCAAQLNSRAASNYHGSSTDELRLEIADVKHALKATQVELNLLDERVKKEASTLTSATKQTAHSALAGLEARLAHLEKMFEKTLNDLRNLSKLTTELEQEIASHEKRLDDVVKLKGTLTSISNAIGQGSSSSSLATSYHVKAGDSLEKIARKYNISVAELRALNNLKNDKIVIGQELKIRDGNS